MRRLGQHFLIRASLLERIAAAACPQPEPLVIEIGPGRGALTEHLLERADRVVAIEIDAALVEHLQRKFAGQKRLELVQADVLELDLARWGEAVVAGNLPYYISTPILERTLAAPWKRAVFLVQKEVAERVAAQPGSRAYGYLSVLARLFAEPEILFAIQPAAFHPPPKVDSAVLRLTPRGRAAELGIPDPAGFLAFVARLFRHKRKTIRNNLPPDEAGRVPYGSLRAEQLTLEQFAEMYRLLVP